MDVRVAGRRSCLRATREQPGLAGRRPVEHLHAVAATSTAEGREPDAEVAQGEAVQVPGAATRNLLGLGSQQSGELPLEAQPWVLPDDASADRVGDLVGS